MSLGNSPECRTMSLLQTTESKILGCGTVICVLAHPAGNSDLPQVEEFLPLAF
jgi:hypothetical protein